MLCNSSTSDLKLVHFLISTALIYLSGSCICTKQYKHTRISELHTLKLSGCPKSLVFVFVTGLLPFSKLRHQLHFLCFQKTSLTFAFQQPSRQVPHTCHCSFWIDLVLLKLKWTSLVYDLKKNNSAMITSLKNVFLPRQITLIFFHCILELQSPSFYPTSGTFLSVNLIPVVVGHFILRQI